jgi:hypothetical protein
VVEFRDLFMAKGRDTLSGYDASEGALYILFMLVLAAHAQSPEVFAVDNFDQALNPRTARALTRWFVDGVLAGGRQVFAQPAGARRSRSRPRSRPASSPCRATVPGRPPSAACR